MEAALQAHPMDEKHSRHRETFLNGSTASDEFNDDEPYSGFTSVMSPTPQLGRASPQRGPLRQNPVDRAQPAYHKNIGRAL